VTTENSDWATNCPEYKVTAVQVGLAVGPEDGEMGNASAVVEPVAVS
jgi:formate dehydrogenase major subunit